MRPTVKLIFLSLIIALTGSVFAQTPTKSRKGVSTGNGTKQVARVLPANKPATADPVSQLGSDLANTVINTTSNPDDHVRCFFTDKQLADLRPIPTVPRLTEADESRPRIVHDLQEASS